MTRLRGSTGALRSRLCATLLLGAFPLLAGCGVADGLIPGVDDKPAIIIYYRDTTAITVADTVQRGTPFSVQVVTYGGGCTRKAARTEVLTSGRVAEVRPYNRTKQFFGQGCDAVLLFVSHQAQLRVDTPGEFTIRVLGQRRDMDTNGSEVPAMLTRVITVR